MNDRFHVEIASTMADYANLAQGIQAFCRQARLSDTQATHLELVIEELVVNVIKHGYRDGRTGAITIDVDAGVELTITLSDDGDPFDPVAATAPDLDLGTEDRPIGGLGIHFVRTFMEEMHYRRHAGRNELTLRKRLAL